ncbi:MAG: hypothetical protein JWQ09_4184 [Segetibacter sp.]|nr:hypothetical protein [Segetibacter sp.]
MIIKNLKKKPLLCVKVISTVTKYAPRRSIVQGAAQGTVNSSNTDLLKRIFNFSPLTFHLALFSTLWERRLSLKII